MAAHATKELFFQYYKTALQIRNAARDWAPLASWFPQELRRFPPIICFGFPTDPAEHIPLVTLAINPSADEVRKRHVCFDDDPDIQFCAQALYFERKPLKWFARAQLMMQTLSGSTPEDRRATYGGFFGGKRNTIHLDLMPVITAAIDGPKRAAQKSKRPFTEPAELQLILNLSAQAILVPLLQTFIERHGTRLVVALGGIDRLNEAGLSVSTCAQIWRGLQWTELSSGPSAPCSDDELVRRTQPMEKAAQLIQKALSAENS